MLARSTRWCKLVTNCPGIAMACLCPTNHIGALNQNAATIRRCRLISILPKQFKRVLKFFVHPLRVKLIQTNFHYPCGFWLQPHYINRPKKNRILSALYVNFDEDFFPGKAVAQQCIQPAISDAPVLEPPYSEANPGLSLNPTGKTSISFQPFPKIFANKYFKFFGKGSTATTCSWANRARHV
jgi:hypothetical protein